MRVRVIFGSGKAWSSGGDDVDSLRSMGNFAARSKAPSAKTKDALCADLQRVNIVTLGSMNNELQQTLPVDGPVSSMNFPQRAGSIQSPRFDWRPTTP